MNIKILLCFLPIIIIYIAMKITLWLTETTKEVDYVSHESERIRGPYVENPYGDIDQDEEET